MILYPVVKVALLMGALGTTGLILGHFRGAWKWLPVWLCAMTAVAFAIRVLRPAFALDSLVHDAPWLGAAAMAVFLVVGAAGVVRATSWWAVVLGTALVGDLAIAAGLCLAEPDPSRRARLVLAASGASLISPWSGASVLALGHGSLTISALGVLLAAIGFAPGGGKPTFAPPDTSVTWKAALLAASYAVLIWLFMLGGVPDLAAMGLEAMPPVFPGHATPVLGGLSILAGILGTEPGGALLAQDTVLHATQTRGAWVSDALRVGLSVGAGLPMLVATRSRLSLGITLWLGQVGLALGWLWFGSHV